MIAISMRLLNAVFLTLLVAPTLSAAAEWVYPLDVVKAEDRFVVADRNWPGVWAVEDGELVDVFAASKRFKTPLNAVRCVAVGPDGAIFAGCSSTRQVFRLDTDEPKKLAGDGVGIGIPMDLAINAAGDIYVSDIELHRIFRLDPAGGEPIELAALRAPRGIYWDEDSLLIVSHGENGLVRMTPDGELTPFVEGQPFNFPHEVARLGDMYFVTDGYADGVWPVDASGNVGEILQADGMINPVGITRDGDRLVIVDPRAKSFYELTAEGDGYRITKIDVANLTPQIGGAPAPPAKAAAAETTALATDAAAESPTGDASPANESASPAE